MTVGILYDEKLMIVIRDFAEAMRESATSDVRRTGEAGESGPVHTTSTFGASARRLAAMTASIAAATATPGRLGWLGGPCVEER